MGLKHILNSFTNICFLLISFFSLHAQSADKQRLIGIQKSRFALMVRHDTLALSTTYLADDLTYIHSNGVVDDKHSLLKDIASGYITYIFIIPEKETVTINGNFAWISGRANIRVKLSQLTGVIDQYIGFVDVYRLKGYQWQLVLCQNARLEKNAPYYRGNEPQVKGSIQPSIY